ncbi:MAG: leucine--tRNA ligase [Actinomycetota bacterium]|nr:leucine--tRNA ligase [Actinomycetota bacterium]
MSYDFANIESKAQNKWKNSEAFTSRPDDDKPKFYLFEYPPYPSGSLHVGHVRNYTIGDVLARFKRMRGYNVLYTQGFDSFGLPNEIAAIENNIHPKLWSKKCIKDIKRQFNKLGFSYDVNRFVTYHDEAYYKWTQWLFLLLLREGLAYKKKASANWCPKCATVLADDQVYEGRCWRCDGAVEKKYLDQWFLAIQKYADRLLTGLSDLKGWPDRIKKTQTNWFGRSEGVEITFKLEERDTDLAIFTTTPELIYGCAFVAVSADHPLVLELIDEGEILPDQIAGLESAKSLSTKSPGRGRGLSLNLTAINPLSMKPCPVFVADYVQSAYGTGAIFGVPAHDKADHEFASEHGLPMAPVVQSTENTVAGCFIPEAQDILINSGPLNGLTVRSAKERAAALIEDKGLGQRAVHYRIRDWLISRQRYWGAPIPIIYCPRCGTVPVPEEHLPVTLPRKVNFKQPGNPLARSTEFVDCRCHRCGRPAKRETDTMDTFVNSSWFYLRYCSPDHDAFMFDKDEVVYWMPADAAIGGVEHATTVYIHDRFITKVLYDAGIVPFEEPFLNLIAHELVIKDGKKMSKSLGNTVDPNEIIAKYGADALRLAILFIAPPEKKLEWKEATVKSCYRFLSSLWRLVIENLELIKPYSGVFVTEADFSGPTDEPTQAIKDIVGKVTADLEKHHFNTCIHSLFKLLKLLSDRQKQGLAGETDKIFFAQGVRALLLLLAPFAPHISEELWEKIGFEGLICKQAWPGYSRREAASERTDLIVQINGKVATIMKAAVTPKAGRKEIERLALGHEAVVQKLNGDQATTTVFIKETTHRILNLIVDGPATPARLAERDPADIIANDVSNSI